MEHTLQVYYQDRLIFHSDGNWLYPLFELEKFLSENDYDPAELVAKDKIIGRAAALLMIYLGLRQVEAGLMSKLGKIALEKHGIDYKYDKLVDRIECKTEQILKDEFDPQKAYGLLKARAKKA